MPRQDLVDDLHETLKGDVDEFFRGKSKGAAPATLVEAQKAPSTPPSPSRSAGPRGEPVVDHLPPTNANASLTPVMMAAFAAMIVTSAVVLFLFLTFEVPTAPALESRERDDDAGEADAGEVGAGEADAGEADAGEVGAHSD